jgi:succinate dehydrogenase / fumarate reductase, flavoprotein subunit
MAAGLGPIRETVDADVIVIGGGLAGAWGAIRARDFPVKVALVEKGPFGKTSCSKFGSGDIQCFIPSEDRMEDWLRAMAEAGDYLGHQEWLEVAYREIYDRVRDMDQMGVKFEKEDGGFARKPGRGRITRQVVCNSAQMMVALRDAALQKGVQEYSGIFGARLIVQDGRVVGLLGIDRVTGDLYLFRGKSVILAAGHCGLKGIYYGHRFGTGDAYAMAYHAGAELARMEFVSHNTCSVRYDNAGMSRFVAMGGKFVNARGECFMEKYHPDLKDMVPLTWLSRAIAMEVKAGRAPIYFDLTSISPEDYDLSWKLIPWTMDLFQKAGIDIRKEKVEWTLAFRGSGASSAGINTDIFGRSNVPGLYASGDAGSSMVIMGAGSGMGGVCFFPCIVFGHKTGEAAALDEIDGTRSPMKIDPYGIEALKIEIEAPLMREKGVEADHVLQKLQRAVIPYDVCILKTEQGLIRAIEQVTEIRKTLLPSLCAPDIHELIKCIETENMTLYAEMMLRSSLLRTESRGLHYREDYPQRNDREWLKWTILGKKGEEMSVRTSELPPGALKFFHP